MRVVEITRHGPPDVLAVRDRPEPQLCQGALLIDVRAIGVNFADVLARLGMYPDAPKPPCVVGYEVAGIVADVDIDAGGTFRIGDRVIAGTIFNGYADRVVVDARDTMRLPEQLSFVEGAAIPVNYATAWAASVRYGAVQKGDRVLVHAAAGGVGMAAIQILRAQGAEVWGAASPTKAAAIREAGVHQAIDYRDERWWQQAPPFDLILDGVGGSIGRRSYELLRPGGRMICYGVSSLAAGDRRRMLHVLRGIAGTRLYSPLGLMRSSRGITGLNMLELWKDRGTVQPWIAPLEQLAADGVIKPAIHAAIDLQNAGEAHRILSDRENVGKVVLVP